MNQENTKMNRLFPLLTFLAVVLTSLSAFAVPTQVTHQGRLLDSAGEPLSGSVQLIFTIYDASEGGTVVWTQESTVDLGETGFYTVTLGDGANPIDSSILERTGSWLELTVDGTALSPRMSMNSVPYAVVAGIAESVAPGAITNDMVDSIDYSKIANVPAAQEDTLDAVTCSPGQTVTWDGAEWICTAVPTGSLIGGASSSVISKVTVTAQGTCGTETVKPRMGLFINRKLVNEIEIPNATYSTFDFNIAPAQFASEIGVAFMNDGDSNGCDRDLMVESIIINDTETIMSVETARVVYDKNAFFDNIDVEPGTDSLLETGVLRFFVSPYTARADEFVATGQSCPSNQYAYGTAADGTIICRTDQNNQYSGSDFMLSAQACPTNQYAFGVTSAGAIRCRADQNTTYSGSNFALSNQTCGSTQAVYGISSSGAPLCRNLNGRSTSRTSCAWSGYVNNYDATYTYTCPGSEFIAGVSSVHNNSTEDRRFQFYCCAAVTN